MDIQHFISSFWQAVTPLELIGFITALLYSILASYEKVWCWPFALISTGIFTYILLHDNVKLQASLQVFYFGMAVYGWYAWVYGKRDSAPLHVVSFPLSKTLLAVVIGIPLTVIAAMVSMHYHVDQPWLDAGLTVYSVIATWLMARKVIQNWLFWMVIDPLSILLYAEDSRKRYLIALLFFIYTIVAIFGYFKWRQELKAQRAMA